jgi:hypothetical protein
MRTKGLDTKIGQDRLAQAALSLIGHLSGGGCDATKHVKRAGQNLQRALKGGVDFSPDVGSMMEVSSRIVVVFPAPSGRSKYQTDYPHRRVLV